MKPSNNKYDLNIGKYKNQNKDWTKRYLIRIIAGVLLFILMLYLIREIEQTIKNNEKSKQDNFEIEIELQ